MALHLIKNLGMGLGMGMGMAQKMAMTTMVWMKSDHNVKFKGIVH